MTKLAGVALALVWLYNGLWCKVLAACPGHAAIVGAVPGLGPTSGSALLLVLGLVETGLAAWVLSGRRLLAGAFVQTALVIGMNAGGLLFGSDFIPDRAAMVVNNLAFLALVWLHARPGAAFPTGLDEGATAWSRGRFDAREGPAELLFGRMYEDWRIEAKAFPPEARVFCVASAGCTAIALAARGHAVTAVDINPAQVAYVQERLRGGPAREGTAERLLTLARRLLPAVGWSAERRRRFLGLEEPVEQVAYWDRALDTSRLRMLFRVILEPRWLRLVFARALLRALPDAFGDILRGRLRRGFARHANRDNPYAWGLLLGEGSPAPFDAGASLPSLELECGDAATYLECCPAGRFHAFSLSNILDGADEAYARRLWSAVRRAGAPRAVVVLRSFANPRDAEEDAQAGRDRAMLWGRVSITTTAGPE